MGDNLRCRYCGRFMKEGYGYNPWGTYGMSESPDDEFICLKCFTPDRKKVLDLMWHPPVRLNISKARKLYETNRR